MTEQRVVYLIGTAAPPVRELAEPLKLLDQAGWSACVVLTPTAASWIDPNTLAAPVRVQPRHPDEQDPFPLADGVLAAPLTFSSLNKVGAGISDTFAVSLINELLGEGTPLVAAPCVKHALRRHPAYTASLEVLTSLEAHVLDPDRITSRGPDGLATFDWNTAIAEFLQAV